MGTAGKVSHPNNLEAYDGVSEHINFADYIYNSRVRRGYMRLEVIEGVLYTIVEYDVTNYFSDADGAELLEYTSGQLSDGIGEGFEQHPCAIIDGEEAYVSPWHWDQKLVVGSTVEEALLNLK